MTPDISEYCKFVVCTRYASHLLYYMILVNNVHAFSSFNVGYVNVLYICIVHAIQVYSLCVRITTMNKL